MKKILPISALIGALLLAGGLTGCGSCGDGTHTHDFTEWEIEKVQTCLEDGLRSRTCRECGETEKEVLKARGYHVYQPWTNWCVDCGYGIDDPTPDLSYEAIDGTENYMVGLGSCTATDIVVPAYYMGHPVVAVREEGFANPDGVTTNGGNIRSIWLPDGIVSIGERAFYGCGKLSLVVLPNTLERIENNAFSGCTSLEHVGTLSGWDRAPLKLTSIGDSAFNNCTKLVAAPLGDALEEVGAFAFRNCAALTTANLDANVKTVGEYAFSGCKNVRYAMIGGQMETLADSVFFGCSSLTEVVVPYRFKYFGSGSFGNCSSLKTFRFPGTKAEWKANVTHADDWFVGEYGDEELPTFYIECSDGYLNQYNVETAPPAQQ